jgi:hypoxanthine phosphoribosyltransferase
MNRGEARILVRRREFELLIPAGEIALEVARIAGEIERDLPPEGTPPPLFLCVLKGALLFCADLLRQMSRPVTLDFVGITSYGDRMTSGPSLTFTTHPGTEIRGRNVIVVEDIVDSGRTVAALRRYLVDGGAASVRIASLLYKPTDRNQGTHPEYVGFDIEDRFVIGYGLDFGEEGRELPDIYVLCDGSSTTECSSPNEIEKDSQ